MSYNLYPNYFQQMGLQQPQMPQNQAQQMQGGFVTVRSEEEARNYPVAYGNSITMKDENSPYIYTKTMGFSQLDRPIFDKYKLVKEKTEEEPEVSHVKTDELEKIQEQIRSLWDAINEMKESEKYGA